MSRPKTDVDHYFQTGKVHLFHRYLDSSKSGGVTGSVPSAHELAALEKELGQFATRAASRASHMEQELRSLRTRFRLPEPLGMVTAKHHSDSTSTSPLSSFKQQQTTLLSGSSARPRKGSMGTGGSDHWRKDASPFGHQVTSSASSLQKSHSFAGSRKRSDASDRPLGSSRGALFNRPDHNTVSTSVSDANSTTKPRSASQSSSTAFGNRRSPPPSPAMSQSSLISNESAALLATPTRGSRLNDKRGTRRKRKHGTITENGVYRDEYPLELDDEDDDDFQASPRGKSNSTPTKTGRRGRPSLADRAAMAQGSPKGVSTTRNTTGSPLKKQRTSSTLSSSSGTHPGEEQSQEAPPPKRSRPKTTPDAVNEDFSRVKVASEVPVTTFWASVEPYFRPLNDGDIKFLQNDGDSLTPFLTPTLGKHYTQVWSEEDRDVYQGLLSYAGPSPTTDINSGSVPGYGNGLISGKGKMRNSGRGVKQESKSTLTTPAAGIEETPTGVPQDSHQLPNVGKPVTNIMDEHLLDKDIGCGPLAERIVSALVQDRLIDPAELSHNEEASGSDKEGKHAILTVTPQASVVESTESPSATDNGPVEVVGLEERLVRELRHIGVLGGEEVDWSIREDDEICAILRHAQRLLRDQVEVNRMRKQRLLEVVRDHMAFQEYHQILEELDKQVEQSYVKRYRGQKTKRKKSIPTKTALSDNVQHAMDRRRRIIEGIGCLFPEEKYLPPSTSIYDGLDLPPSSTVPTPTSQSN
ncbi:Transcriptional regulator [Dispira parvispora]|uniref:Transcriptional regulator n=1 Tax=Dispira parvispora TaxID=1520584 RepID=A0A9W8AXR5_9FUNG|nr:Transcriptional regulator [Dispira parvispora]